MWERPPCRFEVFQQVVRGLRDDGQDSRVVDVVLDVAHNTDAFKALIAKLKRTYPQTPIR